MERPKQEDLVEWAAMPQTRWAIQKLVEEQQRLKDILGDGTTLAENPGMTAQLTARTVGEIAGAGAFKSLIEEEINSDS